MSDKPTAMDEEIARRRDEIVRRMIATPPTPHKPKGSKELKGKGEAKPDRNPK